MILTAKIGKSKVRGTFSEISAMTSKNKRRRSEEEERHSVKCGLLLYVPYYSYFVAKLLLCTRTAFDCNST
eukprot:scaffold5067_cov161-Skeletonema_menzelii.AAC.3